MDFDSIHNIGHTEAESGKKACFISIRDYFIFKRDAFLFFVFLGLFLIGQNGRSGRREPPRSTSFDETSRI